MKTIILSSLARLLSPASGSPNRRRLAILIYHRVLPGRDSMRPNEFDAATFEWQMELLRRYFNPLSLGDALELQKSGGLPPASVCVTFDDGYADNVEVALPILKKWDIPATFFISSGYLDGGRMWNDTILESFKRVPGHEIDLSEIGLGRFSVASERERRQAAYQTLEVLKYRRPESRDSDTRYIASLVTDLPDDLMMTSAQVKQLVDAGMTIGAHTVTHPILAALAIDEAEREIVEGKQVLEKLVGKKLSFFAYPNGKPGQDYTEAHRKLLPRVGFEAACSTHWGVSTVASDNWQLPRFTPWDRDPIRFLVRMILNYRKVR